MRKRKKRILVVFAAAACLYIAAVAAVAFFSVSSSERLALKSVDEGLAASARVLKYLLAEDFHDRAIDADSIGFDEELRNRERMNEFAASAGVAWAYTLVEKDGAFYFSAPTVTEDEARERERWYFYPYEDIPAEFRSAMGGSEPVFVNYRDQWGSYRSIALPQRSPAGKPYLSCIDVEQGDLNLLMRDELARSLLGSFILLLAGIPFVLLYVREIAAHNRLLERLNERLRTDAYVAENRFRSLFEHSADAVIVVDAGNYVTYVNPAYTELFGWTLEELAGKRFAVVPPEYREDAIARFERMRRTGEPYRDFENKRMTKNGGIVDVSISGAPLSEKDRSFAGAMFIYRDRTRRKMLEARVAQDERYRAVAAMAAGAAHDFNNALALIQGNVSLIKLGAPLPEETAELVDDIEATVKKASALTGELLGFAHPASAAKSPVDVGALCGRTARAFAKPHQGIRLELELPESPLYALADENSFERVLLNLFVNADHAMNGEGLLEVSVSLESCALSGSCVAIRVRDSGEGMDEATKSRVFEPFFTTKRKGKGSGLGLATASAVVRDFGGSILVDSIKGEGTVFTITLPAVSADFTAAGHPDSMGPFHK